MKGWLIVFFFGWVGVSVGASYIKDYLLKPVRHLQSGEDRRKLIPAGKRPENKPKPALLEADWEDKDVDVVEGFFTLKDEKKMYWCTLTPKDIQKVENVLVYVHGYTGSSAWMEFNAMATFAKLGNCAVVILPPSWSGTLSFACVSHACWKRAHKDIPEMIGLDMPGHGRSDGEHIYIKGWHPFVGCATKFVEDFCKKKQAEWSEQVGRPLKLFALGESMGGGIVTTMCLKKPDTFNGIVLYSPMIAVSDEIKPHPIVTWIFKHVLCYLLPEWPIAPAKDLTDKCCNHAEQCQVLRDNPFGAKYTMPKLATAYALAFEAPGWMEPRLQNLTTPFLIVHAAEDKVTDPELSKRLFSVAKAQDKSMQLYDKAQHMDPLHGGDREQELVSRVYSDILSWLRERS